MWAVSSSARGAPHRHVLAADPGQGGGDQLVRPGQDGRVAAVIADPSGPPKQRGRGVGPLPSLRHRRSRVEEIGSDDERMRRQRGVPFPAAPAANRPLRGLVSGVAPEWARVTVPAT